MTTKRAQKTAAELAELCGAILEGNGDLAVTGPCGLGEAEADHVSFLAQPKYIAQLETTRAGVVLVSEDQVVERDDLVLLRCKSPESSFTQVILAFAPEVPEIPEGVSPYAHIDPTADVHPTARVAAGAQVGPGGSVGARTILHPGVIVSAHGKVGPDTILHPHVVIYPYSEVGARCVLHAGAVIGCHGFGFHPIPAGVPEQPLWHKTPQVGNAVVEDDCELGSSVAIDCARFGTTRVRRGCKLDNMVHVGHNVDVGEDTLLLAQVGIAGSTTIGKQVIIAGQAGVAGHKTIGDGAKVLGGSGVISNIAAGEEVIGFPTGPRRQKLRAMVGGDRAAKNIRVLKDEVRELRAQVRQLLELQGGSEAAPAEEIGETEA